ncbi:hypothetical protein C1889_18330 [Pseudomonas sp. FW507-12TSA]|nr:hypothetical protein C1889_18330 [Pseudomonas sp. FW507-12TSA]
MRLILKRYFRNCAASSTALCLQKGILLLSSPPLFLRHHVFISLKPSQHDWQKKTRRKSRVKNRD